MMIGQFQSTTEPHLTATLLIQSPCCYGYFILAQAKAQSVISLIKEPFCTTANPLD